MLHLLCCLFGLKLFLSVQGMVENEINKWKAINCFYVTWFYAFSGLWCVIVVGCSREFFEFSMKYYQTLPCSILFDLPWKIIVKTVILNARSKRYCNIIRDNCFCGAIWRWWSDVCSMLKTFRSAEICARCHRAASVVILFTAHLNICAKKKIQLTTTAGAKLILLL